MLRCVSRRDEILLTHREAIRSAAIRHNASSIALVGSVARGDDDESSDYDFLAEFLPGTTLFDIAELELELQDLLGRNVDVAEASALTARSRSMLADAIPL